MKSSSSAKSAAKIPFSVARSFTLSSEPAASSSVIARASSVLRAESPKIAAAWFWLSKREVSLRTSVTFTNAPYC